MLKEIINSLGKAYFKLIPIKKSNLANVNKIMIFKPGAIGDIVMTTPFLKALRKRFPKAKIDFYVGEWSVAVLENNPNIDEIISFKDDLVFGKRKKGLKKLVKKIRKENYDLSFTLDRSYLVSLFTYVCKIPMRVGFDRNGEGFANTISVPYHDLKHDVEFYLDLAKIVGAKSSNKKMELFITKKEKEYAKLFLKDRKIKNDDLIIGINPGGGKNPGQTVFLKRWPKQKYIELCNEISNKHKNAKIIFFGGPSDVVLIKEIQKQIITKTSSCAGISKLRESAALMKACKVFVTNDSGPMHMSAAMGTPTISIFGPTDPIKLAPIGKKHIVVKSNLDCMPCYLNGSFANCKHHNCMQFIEPVTVLEAIEKVIK